MLKTTENTHPKRKISHTGKIWGEKNFQKKIYRERHTHRETSTKGGYGTDLQVITHVYLPRFSTFVNKNKFFSTRIEFLNLYKVKNLDKLHLRRFRNSLTLRHLQTNLTQINIEKS